MDGIDHLDKMAVTDISVWSTGSSKIGGRTEKWRTLCLTPVLLGTRSLNVCSSQIWMRSFIFGTYLDEDREKTEAGEVSMATPDSTWVQTVKCRFSGMIGRPTEEKKKFS